MSAISMEAMVSSSASLQPQRQRTIPPSQPTVRIRQQSRFSELRKSGAAIILVDTILMDADTRIVDDSDAVLPHDTPRLLTH